VIEGYAAVFNVWSGTKDRKYRCYMCFDVGAFGSAIGGDVVALYDHNADYRLGEAGNGSLRIEQDDVGLWVRIEPPELRWVDTLCEHLEGRTWGMSLEYIPCRTSEESTPYGVPGLVVHEVSRVFEVTVTPRPLFPATVVTVRDSRSSMNQDWRRQLAAEATL